MSMITGVLREDVRKLNREYYSLKDKKINYYHLPKMQYVVASGVNNRNIYQLHDYKEIWTIGRFINRVKYYTKRELQKNFSRMPIEIEWGNTTENRTEFLAMMWVPEYINEDLFNVALKDLKDRNPELEINLSLIEIPQRFCAQLLHKGDYSYIDSTKKLFIDELSNNDYRLKGKPQEIFLNHPHCNPPEKLNILLRQELFHQ